MVQFKVLQDSNRVRSLGNLGKTKRKFRIVKRANNIPVLGVCEYCNAEFIVDPETIGRPKDAHDRIQKQFIAHKCERLDVKKSAARIVSEVGRIALSASSIWDAGDNCRYQADYTNYGSM